MPRPKSTGRLSIHPSVFRDPVDKNANPRVYHHEFHEHEDALAFTRKTTAEHHARFGMQQGCRHTSGFWKPKH